MMETPDPAPKSSSTVPTRAWALDKLSNAAIRVKPRRPYTPYNLFYLLERELVVQGHGPTVTMENAAKKASMEANKPSTIGGRPEDDIPLPARYKNVVMLPMWYDPNLKEKRKHRKTHGKISFKDLTEIISKNWATIDVETKDYCTRVSEIGRKRYKEQMTRYNASQKIIQLKEEHAAMERAKKTRLDVMFQKKDYDSPSRPKKRDRNPVTPNRVLSQHAPIVTPPNHGYNNRVPVFSSSGPPSFYPYGPPPPLPPPMSHSMQGQPPLFMQGRPPHSMQGQHLSPSMPMYHQYHQYHHHYSYPPAPDQNKLENAAHNQTIIKSNNEPSRGMKVMKFNKGHSNGRSGGGNFFSNLSKSGVDVTVDVKVSVKKEEPSERNSMTHDEAMRLCNLMGTDSPVQKMVDCGGGLLKGDALLREIPSFDFDDHHSLSTEDGGGPGRELAVTDGVLGQGKNQEDNMLDLIRGELLPLGLDEEDSFESRFCSSESNP